MIILATAWEPSGGIGQLPGYLLPDFFAGLESRVTPIYLQLLLR
jgi:hypothetical protein